MVEWFQRMPVGVLTADRVGALLFVNGERYEVQPRPAREVDPTGAGDVFAATFLIQYQRDGDAWQAAAAAACAGLARGRKARVVGGRRSRRARCGARRISTEPVGDVLDTRRRRSSDPLGCRWTARSAITAGAVSAEARLNDSKTAGAIWDALPIEAKGQTWGDEIYFDIGVTAAPEQAREVVDAGRPRLLAARPAPSAFSSVPRRRAAATSVAPASAVNVVGKIVGDARRVQKVRAGARVTIERQ